MVEPLWEQEGLWYPKEVLIRFHFSWILDQVENIYASTSSILTSVKSVEKFHLNIQIILQVFLLLSSEMFSVDVIWGLCNWSALSDSLFCFLYTNLSWLLHHVWAHFHIWPSYHSCTWMCLLLNSCRVQSFCTILHSEFPKLAFHFDANLAQLLLLADFRNYNFHIVFLH